MLGVDQAGVGEYAGDNPLSPQLIGSGVKLLDMSALLGISLIAGVTFFVSAP